MSGPRLTRDAELIRTARTVVKLQRQIAKARRQIKAWRAELRHERKMLRGLAYAGDTRPDVAPLRAHGGTTGIVQPPRVVGNLRDGIVLEDLGPLEPTPRPDAGIAAADRAFRRSQKVED